MRADKLKQLARNILILYLVGINGNLIMSIKSIARQVFNVKVK
jgi:hypothetical protein